MKIGPGKLTVMWNFLRLVKRLTTPLAIVAKPARISLRMRQSLKLKSLITSDPGGSATMRTERMHLIIMIMMISPQELQRRKKLKLQRKRRDPRPKQRGRPPLQTFLLIQMNQHTAYVIKSPMEK